MENKYEVVIIGSGLGGLSTAYILAKHGYKVAVFEKNTQFGGCLQSFVRQGVKFETGMHYIGSMKEGQILHRYFNYLSLLNDIELSPLDPTGYDIISFRDDLYHFANGHCNFIDTLSKKFPQNRKDIENYVDTLHKITYNSPYYSFKDFDNINLIDPEHVKISVNNYLDGISNNETLNNILAGNSPLYAGVKNKTPLYIHALISDFYINSAYRIVNSSDTIAKSLIISLKKMGADLYNNATVNKIICDDEKAVAIRLNNGELIDSKYIISDIHPETLLDMIDSHLIRKAYRQRICNMQQTVSTFTVYIKFKDNTVPYLNSNFFKYRSRNVWDCETYSDNIWPKNYLYMHQCYEKNQKWAKGAILFAFMKYSDVLRWQGTTVGRRGTEYETFKTIKADKLLAALEEDFPGIRNNIENYWTSTPLTYQDYTATKEGSTYGVLRDVTSPMQTFISQRTKIPNLFLTGQNTNSHGILGVIISAIITAGELVGRNTLMDGLKNIY